MPHVQLTRRSRPHRTVRDAVDHHATRPTDAFTAVVVECDRFPSLGDEPLVHNVEHLEEGHVGADVPRLVCDEGPLRVRRCLSPNVQFQIH